MQKLELLLELATNEDIEVIKLFCEKNKIEFDCTFRSFYKDGQLIRTKGDKVVSVYHFYIVATEEQFNDLNTLLNNRLKKKFNNQILEDFIKEMKKANEYELSINKKFEIILSSIDDIDMLYSLYQYSSIMNYSQVKMLENRIDKCLNSSDKNNNIKKERDISVLRERTGMNRKQFCDYLGIPYRTVEDWENGKSKCVDYLYDALKMILEFERKIKY